MSQLEKLKTHLKKGTVYRREDLTQWSNSIDRHLEELEKEGMLEKLSWGIYYYPRTTVFGKVPPKENELVESFLKDKRFLTVSPNLFNSLGVGTTQLYNKRIVYNHKRHGRFKLGSSVFDFRIKHHFPARVTEEFLMVDLADSLSGLAENYDEVLKRMLARAKGMNRKKLEQAVMYYGSAKARKLFKPVLMEDKQV